MKDITKKEIIGAVVHVSCLVGGIIVGRKLQNKIIDQAFPVKNPSKEIN